MAYAGSSYPRVDKIFYVHQVSTAFYNLERERERERAQKRFDTDIIQYRYTDTDIHDCILY